MLVSRFASTLLPASVLAAHLGAQSPGAALVYPPSPRGEVVDNYHGASVADPYRWLEDPDSPASRSWIESQNELTFGYLGTLPQRRQIRERLERVWNYAKYSAPVRAKQSYFTLENTGLQNQPVLYVRERIDGEPRALLDMNSASVDGTVALALFEPSPDGRLLAYGVSAGGSDWTEVRVRDVRSSRDLADTLKWIKFSGIAWTHDNAGFFYSRYDEPAPGTAMSGVNRNQKLYYHRIGAPQAQDELILARPDEPDWGFDAEVSDDGLYCVIHIWEGTDPRNRLYFIDLARAKSPTVNAPVVRLIDEADATYRFVQNVGTMFLLRTDFEAPRGRVIGVSINAPRREAWRTTVGEALRGVLVGAEGVYDRLALTYLENASSSVKFYSHRGSPMGSLPLPALGTISEIHGKFSDKEMFYTFTSFLTPPTTYRYDLERATSSVFQAPVLPVDVSPYETRQILARSRDGTSIPIFVTARRGLTLDGTHPTILYGYGGFNVSLTPEFSAEKLVWLEMGGVYAVANLRGGGEFGKTWHDAGTLDRKQNVFDDAFAAAEHLIAQGYTSRSKLAIQGGSNGGLLVGAAMTQRPDLFAVALPSVGVMDMLRYHKFTIGWAWVSDYGSADNPEQFRYLHRYSPLHNLKAGTVYPATLITTGDHDDRVVPGHSFKFAAALQASHAGSAPVLIRIDTRAGHGAGKPTMKRIEEAADRLTFTAHHLGVPPAFLP